MCGPKFCSMKITQEVRDFAAQKGLDEQNAVQWRLGQTLHLNGTKVAIL